MEADAEGSVTFSKDEPNAGGAKGGVNIALAEANSRGGVIDISSTNGANRISTENMASGVYMIRLVNGNHVKTQKIVIK